MLKVKSNMGACKSDMSDMYGSLTNVVFCTLFKFVNVLSVGD